MPVEATEVAATWIAKVLFDPAGGVTATATDATAPDAGVAGAPLQMAPVTVESFARRTTGDDRVKSCPAVAVNVGTTCWV